MSILDSNKIDIVATRPDSSIVKLVIADHLTWDDLDEHARLLQDKINTYIAFVESGQLKNVRSPQIPPEPRIVLSLVLKHSPSSDASRLLLKMTEFLAGVGLEMEIDLRHETS